MQAHCKSAHKAQDTQTKPLDDVIRSLTPDSIVNPNAEDSASVESFVDDSSRSLSPSPEVEEVPWPAADNVPGELLSVLPHI